MAKPLRVPVEGSSGEGEVSGDGRLVSCDREVWNAARNVLGGGEAVGGTCLVWRGRGVKDDAKEVNRGRISENCVKSVLNA